MGAFDKIEDPDKDKYYYLPPRDYGYQIPQHY